MKCWHNLRQITLTVVSRSLGGELWGGSAIARYATMPEERGIAWRTFYFIKKWHGGGWVE